MTDHRRLTKKQLKHDKFLEAIYAAWAYAQDNIGVVIGGAVALIAIVVLGVRVGGSVGGPHGNPEAERALSAARTQFLTGQGEAATAALEDVRRRYGSSAAGKEATLLLANSLYQAGDYARALTVFQDFLRKPLHDDLTRDNARLAIAACREETGDLAGASEGYREIWDTAFNPALRVQAAMAAARCERAQGQTDRAAALYRSVVADYPESPEADTARFLLLEIESPS